MTPQEKQAKYTRKKLEQKPVSSSRSRANEKFETDRCNRCGKDYYDTTGAGCCYKCLHKV
jgi:hypothetical protein